MQLLSWGILLNNTETRAVMRIQNWGKEVDQNKSYSIVQADPASSPSNKFSKKHTSPLSSFKAIHSLTNKKASCKSFIYVWDIV